MIPAIPRRPTSPDPTVKFESHRDGYGGQSIVCIYSPRGNYGPTFRAEVHADYRGKMLDEMKAAWSRLHMDAYHQMCDAVDEYRAATLAYPND